MARALRFFGILAVLTALASCGASEPKWAPQSEVARAAYVHDGPPTITLFTVINNKNGAGAHSALMVNGSQRVIFDPAGTWHHPQLPERNDVHFGMSDPIVDFYIDYHSRITYRTVVQEIVVSPQVARLAMQGILSYGAVPKAQCSNAITSILTGIPGLENIPHTWFPNKLSAEFGKLPGVSFDVIYDDSPDDNSGVVVGPQADYLRRG